MKSFRRFFPSWKVALLYFAILAVSGTLLSGAFVLYLIKGLPSLEQIDNRQISESTKIYDRTGTVLLYELSAGEKRTVAPFNEIPAALKNATIAIEDERFYDNPAFDWRGILRAGFVNLRRGEISQGGSTLTQQLARNAFLSPEQTVTRKIRELILAIRLANHYSKDEILHLYLNEVPYGPTVYGVEAASRAYFNKPVRELSLAESAVLAAITKAPTYYSPWGSHVPDLLRREKLILQKMRDLQMISAEEFARAASEEVSFQPRGIGIKAPHFVLLVQDYLVKKYGEDVVRSGGLSVVTTLDWELQQAGERAVVEGAERNEKLYGGKNAALVAQDVASGQLLALVGSRDYFDTKNEGNFNVATQGLRQPGSALKPFSYLSAFAKGFRPETIIFDVPTEFAPNNPECPAIPDYERDGPPCFHPHNFDETFRGPITLRDALAQSVNIPAVKVLYLAGLTDVLRTLADFGITTLDDPSRYGLSLVLGGGEVRLHELVGAYGVLAADGIRHGQGIVLEIKDAAGKTLESYSEASESVADPQHVRLINGVLSDTEARAGLFGSSMGLTVFPGYDVALKTGTSNDYHDAWAIGYTPSLVVGVWAGNNNNAAMHKQGSSILAAVPIWSAFMKEALRNQPQEAFVKPDTNPASKPFLSGEYMPGNQIHAELFWVNREDPSGPPPEDPTRDPQFNNWEFAVLSWVKDNAAAFVANPLFPRSATSALPIIALQSPAPGAFFSSPVLVEAKIFSEEALVGATLLWNGRVIQEIVIPNQTPYTVTASFSPPGVLPQNSLELRVLTASGKVGVVASVVYARP
jgi:penicillin-binding protein 1C